MNDDKQLTVIRRDYSGGMNNRQHGSVISDNQATVLYNVDIGVPGETSQRPGLTSVEGLGTDPGTGVFGFMPSGETYELIVTHGTKLEGWIGSGSFVEHKTDFTAGTTVTMFKAGESDEGDVLMVYVSGNNWFRMKTDYTFQDLGNTAGTGSDSPPASGVAIYFRNRMWILKDDLLYWSDSFPSDYATAFNTGSQNYRMDVGVEQAIIAIRDLGLISFGKDAVWGINPSVTPAATDKPDKILDIGCVAGKTAVQVGDDIMFLAADGVRALFRTQQDKVQLGESIPLSFPLKTQFEALSWGSIDKSCAVYFDNKYFISVPKNTSSYNNEVWVYYPAYKAWMVITGWEVSAFSVIKLSGEERLYATDSQSGNVYRAWYGTDDNKRDFTVSKSTNTVTATSGTFEATDAGKTIYWSNGTVDVIDSYTDSTHVDVVDSGTISSQTAYIGTINYQLESREEDMGLALNSKSGGEVKYEVESGGSHELKIFVSLDAADFTLLGTINTEADAPTLPVTLPFNLAGTEIVRGSFHLDSFGPWEQIRLKESFNLDNSGDAVKVLKRSIITYADEYGSE